MRVFLIHLLLQNRVSLHWLAMFLPPGTHLKKFYFREKYWVEKISFLLMHWISDDSEMPEMFVIRTYLCFETGASP